MTLKELSEVKEKVSNHVLNFPPSPLFCDDVYLIPDGCSSRVVGLRIAIDFLMAGINNICDQGAFFVVSDCFLKIQIPLEIYFDFKHNFQVFEL